MIRNDEKNTARCSQYEACDRPTDPRRTRRPDVSAARHAPGSSAAARGAGPAHRNRDQIAASRACCCGSRRLGAFGRGRGRNRRWRRRPGRPPSARCPERCALPAWRATIPAPCGWIRSPGRSCRNREAPWRDSDGPRQGPGKSPVLDGGSMPRPASHLSRSILCDCPGLGIIRAAMPPPCPGRRSPDRIGRDVQGQGQIVVKFRHIAAKHNGPLIFRDGLVDLAQVAQNVGEHPTASTKSARIAKPFRQQLNASERSPLLLQSVGQVGPAIRKIGLISTARR